MNSASIALAYSPSPIVEKLQNFALWLIAIIVGSSITILAFLVLPNLNFDEKKDPTPIIEIDFLPWQKTPPPIKTKKIEKKTPVKPKPKIKPKPKPKPKPIVKPKPKPKIIEKQKVEPTVKPDVTVPEKVKPVEKPIPVVEEPVAQTQDIPELPLPPIATDATEILPTPIHITKLSNVPRFIHKQKPIYPLSMKQQGKEGTVKLEILIDANGKVRKVSVRKSAGKLFDEAAIMAIKNSSFTAADVNGKKVASLLRMPVRFRLR